MGLKQDKPVTFLSPLSQAIRAWENCSTVAGDNFPDNDGCNKKKREVLQGTRK